ncbi:MAG: heme NO-binding domain-containing protein [Thermoanaerobaculia bacterium]|nr:heme NO-binding domain-containing protein [Thermoanaerobaculia bacterium]
MTGTAPQTKGSNLIPTIKALRGQAEIARSVLPEPLHRYLERRLLPSAWYPEEDLNGLMRALIEVLGGSEQEMWPYFGREAAKTHAASSYASFVRHGPETLIEHFPVYWPLLHTSGRWEVSLEPDSGFATLTLLDFAVGMPHYGPLISAYLGELLQLSGASAVNVRCVETDEDSATLEAEWQA